MNFVRSFYLLIFLLPKSSVHFLLRSLNNDDGNKNNYVWEIKGLLHHFRDRVRPLEFFFLYFICFWVLTVFTNVQENKITNSTCLKVYLTQNVLHK